MGKFGCGAAAQAGSNPQPLSTRSHKDLKIIDQNSSFRADIFQFWTNCVVKLQGRDDERSAGWSSESSAHLTLNIPVLSMGGLCPR